MSTIPMVTPTIINHHGSIINSHQPVSAMLNLQVYWIILNLNIT